MMVHRRILASVLMAAISLAAAASSPGEAYFCATQGARLHYERTEAKDGSLRWRHEMAIGSVSADGAVEYSSCFTKPGGAVMYGGPVKMNVHITPAGDVEMDVAQTVAAVFANLVGTRNIKSGGGRTVLPSDMAPGDILPDASGSVTAGLAGMKVDVTERRVLKTETVTTPAGTFDCIVVSEHKVEKGTLRNRVTTALTWYARGIGMIRHDTYDRNMKLETSERLVRIDCL